MNCWRFGPSIFDACRSIQPSARGEFELPNAVRFSIRVLDERFRAIRVEAGVLDLSRREDIAGVEQRLAEHRSPALTDPRAVSRLWHASSKLPPEERPRRSRGRASTTCSRRPQCHAAPGDGTRVVRSRSHRGRSASTPTTAEDAASSALPIAASPLFLAPARDRLWSPSTTSDAAAVDSGPPAASPPMRWATLPADRAAPARAQFSGASRRRRHSLRERSAHRPPA